jgi:hypothetical protein
MGRDCEELAKKVSGRDLEGTPPYKMGRDCEVTRLEKKLTIHDGTPPYKMGRDCEFPATPDEIETLEGTPPYKMGRDCECPRQVTSTGHGTPPYKMGRDCEYVSPTTQAVPQRWEHPHTRWGEIARQIKLNTGPGTSPYKMGERLRVQMAWKQRKLPHGNIPIQDGERLRVASCREPRCRPPRRRNIPIQDGERLRGAGTRHRREPGLGTSPYKMGRDCESLFQESWFFTYLLPPFRALLFLVLF